MVIPRINLKQFGVDAGGAAGVLVVLALGYFVLIRGPLDDLWMSKQLQTKQLATTLSLTSLQKDFIARAARLRELRKELEVRASWLANADLPDEVLSRVNKFARQCDVCITRWQPQGTQLFPEYQAQVFSVEGKASWPSLLRWLALLEEGVPLLDATHFSVTAPTKAGRDVCEFSCSLKLYTGAPEKPAEMAVAR